MVTCREIESLITPYIDEQASADERVVVAEHLRTCDRCRASASGEAAARLIVRHRAASLREEAPKGLRARCRPAPAAPAWHAWWPFAALHPIPVWAATFAVLLIASAVIVSVGGSSRVLAAELTLDHLKCFALFEKSSGPGQAATIGRRMEAEYGWHVTVPGSSAALKLRLVGGRRCFSTDGRVAHILYRHDGRPLSLFVIPSSSRAAEQMAVLGHEAIIWSDRGVSYAVVARGPRSEVEQVAEYMRDAVGR